MTLHFISPLDIVFDLAGNSYGSLLRNDQALLLMELTVPEIDAIFVLWKEACQRGGLTAQRRRQMVVLAIGIIGVDNLPL